MKNGYNSILFGLQHVTYNEKTLGFKKFLPADAVVKKNIRENIDSNLFKKPFYAEINFFEPHRPFDFGGVKPFKSKGISVPKYIPNNHDIKKEFASMQGAIKKMDDSVAKIINILKRTKSL